MELTGNKHEEKAMSSARILQLLVADLQEIIDLVQLLDDIDSVHQRYKLQDLTSLQRLSNFPEAVTDKEPDGIDATGTQLPTDADIDRGILKFTDAMLKLVNETELAGSAIKKIHPGLKKLVGALDLAEELESSLSGISKLVAGSEGGISAAGLLGASSEIVSGMSGIVEASTVLGPEAVAIASAAELVYKVISSEVPANGKILQMGFNLENSEKRLWNSEKQKDREKLIDLYNVHNLQQLAEIEQELNSNYLVADRMERVNKALSELDISFPELKNKWVKKQDFKNVAADVHEVFFPQVSGPWAERQKLATQEKELWYNAVYFGFGHPDMKKYNDEVAALRKKAKPFGLREEVNYTLPSETEWENYRRGQRGLPISENSQKSPKELVVRDILKSRMQNSPPSRQVTINLNKSLIEHFTVNTKGTQESINELRRKVEEVLLEILNNANVK